VRDLTPKAKKDITDGSIQIYYVPVKGLKHHKFLGQKCQPLGLDKNGATPE